MAQNYQDLEGGTGKEVNFRPPRYVSAEFGAVGATVWVALLDLERSCELHDVSQNGVAFEWPDAQRLLVGDTIPVLVVSFGKHEAYRGAARVGSVRDVEGKRIVGVSFLDTLMNIEDVLQLRDVKAWRGAGQGLALKDRSWRVPGYESFKSRIAEFRLFLLDAEEQLGELEASLPWHVAHGDQESPARRALIDRLNEEVAQEIVSASNAINEAWAEVPETATQALKEYALRHLQPILMQAPWMRRAREKPLGYPGDYELMNGLYGNHFTGNTLFAKTLNLGFVSTLAGGAVRERKNLIKRELAQLVTADRAGSRPVRILSIAAGPAQEIYELLWELTELKHPVEIVLFDQDQRALAFSYARLKQVAGAKMSDRLHVVYLHDSIKRLLRDSSIFAQLGAFDAIFACGLFDYLQPRTAASLAGSLYESLGPAGKLYIGNMTPDNPSRWFMEIHLEWSLTYRERDEMIQFARLGAPDATIEIIEEKTGINPFVVLRRER